ncbi:MAG: hypothetical protein GW854_06725 [Erythrobacter sp.]|nr:hypothetical protein [Erythrobacter sp.]
MATATRPERRHPANLVSIVHVDGPLQEGEEYRRLTCFGAFEVSFVDGDPAFSCHHMSTTDNNDRALFLRRLGSLSHDRHVVLGCSEANETFWDRRYILEAGLVYLDIIDRLKNVQPSNLNLMSAPEDAMINLAETFGLRNCYETHLLGQAKAAGVRSQLIWLAYVATTMGKKETRSLFAAFQAWHAIEMARPIPF